MHRFLTYRNRFIKAFLIISCLVLFYFNIYQSSKRSRQDYFAQIGEVEGWEYNISRDAALYVLPNNDTTMILPQNFCKSPTSLLVIVCSSPSNFEIRNTIRETWGSPKEFANFTINIYFLMGEVNDSILHDQIQQESLTFGDVIQERFIDSYNNLTIKSLMMLKLVKKHCIGNVRYLMKTDDDTYVNIQPLVKVLKSSTTNCCLLMGFLMRKVVPIRKAHNKWNAPYYLYKERFYPNYLSGTGYVMSKDVVTKLYNASFHTSIYYLEDVYITGMLPQAVNLKPKHNIDFAYYKRSFDPCIYQNAITTHRLSDGEMRKLYSIIRETNFQKQCKKKPQNKPNPFPQLFWFL